MVWYPSKRTFDRPFSSKTEFKSHRAGIVSTCSLAGSAWRTRFVNLVAGSIASPPGCDASPSQSYPEQYVTGTHSYTCLKRDNVEQSFLSKETTQQ